MKEFIIAEIKNDFENNKIKLNKGQLGIIIEQNNDLCKFLLLNNKNLGEYAIIDININNLIKKYELTKDLQNELTTFLANLKQNNFTNFNDFNNQIIKENDCVEILNDKYNNLGINKKDVGIVISNYAINNKVEVDFTKVDNNGKLLGNIVVVDIKDIKLI